MAEKKVAPVEKLEPIEKLKEDCQTKAYIYAGVLTANGWSAGKQLTEESYKKAVEAFLKAPIGGREVKNVR